MRFYIISDNTRNSITVANEINSNGSTAIISEKDGSDQRTAILDLKENVDVDDFCVVINRSPKEFTIAANKIQDARAVLCKDREDSAEAYDAKANVLIFDSKVDTDTLIDLIDGVLSRSGKGVQAHAKAKAYQEQPQQADADGIQPMRQPKGNPLKDVMDRFTKGTGSQPQDSQPRRQMQTGGSAAPAKRKSNKGIFGSLKDALGLEEDEEE